jgi:predicted MPP superfamily phosphohydrolase
MDTIPFHLILFALDLVLWAGMFLWIRRRRVSGQGGSQVYQYEKSLFVPNTKIRQSSRIWDLTGVFLFGFFGLGCFTLLSRLIFTDEVQKHVYNFNVGQCIVEGMTLHFPLFFFAASFLLFWNTRRILAVFPFLFGLLFLGFGIDVLYVEPYRLVVEHYEIKTSKIKKPLKIVFVTDIQTDRVSQHERRTLKKIQEQNADLIILGGDYLQYYPGTPYADELPEKFRQLFLEIPLKAPLGVYAIHGNIGPTNEELFKDTGIEPITSSTLFEHWGADQDLGPIDLEFLGLGDSRGFSELRGGPEEALPQTGNFVVMAGHYPNYAINGYDSGPTENFKGLGFMNAKKAPDLMLAGHTHGGQFVIPGFGAVAGKVVIPVLGSVRLPGGDHHVVQMPHEMMSGFFTFPNGGHLLISRGTGMDRGWAPRIRFLCPPEISVIDIVPE